MNSIIALTILATFGFAAAQVAVPIEPTVENWETNPLVTDTSVLKNLRMDVQEFGCEINLCFVLDGSQQITPDQYQDQKNFADLIVAITTTDEPANYCAVQYNDFYTPISPRTGDQLKFLEKLHRSTQVPQAASRVNVDRGFRYVVNQLLDRGEVANKVVFFSKGGRKFGPGPKQISSYFQRNDGGICGVVVGNDNTKFLEKIAPGAVVNFDGFFDLSEIVVAVVSDLCKMPCGQGARSC